MTVKFVSLFQQLIHNRSRNNKKMHLETEKEASGRHFLLDARMQQYRGETQVIRSAFFHEEPCMGERPCSRNTGRSLGKIYCWPTSKTRRKKVKVFCKFCFACECMMKLWTSSLRPYNIVVSYCVFIQTRCTG